MNDTQRGDKSPTAEGNGSELQTDGGSTRRRFLGAAAAALTLVPAAGAAEAEARGDDGRNVTVDENPPIGDTRVEGEILSSLVTERYTEQTSYTITSYPTDPNAQVGLEMSNEHASFGLNLTKNQAEQLAALILNAAREDSDE